MGSTPSLLLNADNVRSPQRHPPQSYPTRPTPPAPPPAPPPETEGAALLIVETDAGVDEGGEPQQHHEQNFPAGSNLVAEQVSLTQSAVEPLPIQHIVDTCAKRSRQGEEDSAEKGGAPPRKRPDWGSIEHVEDAPEDVGLAALAAEVDEDDHHSHQQDLTGPAASTTVAAADLSISTTVSVAPPSVHQASQYGSARMAGGTTVAPAALDLAPPQALDVPPSFQPNFSSFPSPQTGARTRIDASMKIVSDSSANPLPAPSPLGSPAGDAASAFNEMPNTTGMPSASAITTVGEVPPFLEVSSGAAGSTGQLTALDVGPESALVEVPGLVYTPPPCDTNAEVQLTPSPPPPQSPTISLPMTVSEPSSEPQRLVDENFSVAPCGQRSCDAGSPGYLAPPFNYTIPTHHLLHTAPVPPAAFTPAAAAAVAAIGSMGHPYPGDPTRVASTMELAVAATDMSTRLSMSPPPSSEPVAMGDGRSNATPIAPLLTLDPVGANVAPGAASDTAITSPTKTRSRPKKKDDAVNVEHPRRNRNRPQCAANGCRRRPLFGVEGTRQGLFCANHKLPDMTNVVCRRCEVKGCKRQPSFGMPGSRALRCASHKLQGMVNVLSASCVFRGCMVCPSFGKQGDKKPSVCASHRREGDVDLVTRRCHHEGCVRRPVFGHLRDRKAFYCSSHKLQEMVNVFAPRCEFLGCLRPPAFGPPDALKPTRCSKHQDEGYEYKR